MNYISIFVRTESSWRKEHDPFYPLFPSICIISKFSTKSIVFQKKCFIAFMIKKGELHVFEELSNLYLIVLLIVTFLFFRVLLQKIEPSWKNYWLELQNQAKRKITNIQTAPDYSSATAIMLVIFWTERDFCIVSDCRNKFSNKVKNL